MSICERQNIINRKFRVKKKCSFLNKLSERKWGPFKNDRKDRDESD